MVKCRNWQERFGKNSHEKKLEINRILLILSADVHKETISFLIQQSVKINITS